MEPRTIQLNAELTVVQAMEQVLAWDVAPKQSELLRPAEVTRWLADKQRLVDAIAAYHATLPTEQGKEPMKNTVLLIPSDAWETLHETLTLDAQSAACDPALRQTIKQALEQVRPITDQVSGLLDVAEEVPRCAHLLTGAGDAHVIGAERMGKLNRALRFFRSTFVINGGQRQYRKQLV